jgi:hypothetical protein
MAESDRTPRLPSVGAGVTLADQINQWNERNKNPKDGSTHLGLPRPEDAPRRITGGVGVERS